MSKAELKDLEMKARAAIALEGWNEYEAAYRVASNPQIVLDLIATYKKSRRINRKVNDEARIYRAERDQLEKKLKVAIEALKFYEKAENWDEKYVENDLCYLPVSGDAVDGGDKARAALSAIKKIK